MHVEKEITGAHVFLGIFRQLRSDHQCQSGAGLTLPLRPFLDLRLKTPTRPASTLMSGVARKRALGWTVRASHSDGFADFGDQGRSGPTGSS